MLKKNTATTPRAKAGSKGLAPTTATEPRFVPIDERANPHFVSFDPSTGEPRTEEQRLMISAICRQAITARVRISRRVIASPLAARWTNVRVRVGSMSVASQKNFILYIWRESKVRKLARHDYRKGERLLLAAASVASIVDALVWLLSFGRYETDFRSTILFSPWVDNLEY